MNYILMKLGMQQFSAKRARRGRFCRRRALRRRYTGRL